MDPRLFRALRISRKTPLFVPASGLEIPGSAEAAGRLIFLLNVPSRLGELRTARSSLIRRKASLIGGFNSLLGGNYFPVPSRREFDCNSLILLALSVEIWRSEARIDEFPCIFPASREFRLSETSSLLTASSSGESVANRFCWILRPAFPIELAPGLAGSSCSIRWINFRLISMPY